MKIGIDDQFTAEKRNNPQRLFALNTSSSAPSLSRPDNIYSWFQILKKALEKQN